MYKVAVEGLNRFDVDVEVRPRTDGVSMGTYGVVNGRPTIVLYKNTDSMQVSAYARRTGINKSRAIYVHVAYDENNVFTYLFIWNAGAFALVCKTVGTAEHMSGGASVVNFGACNQVVAEVIQFDKVVTDETGVYEFATALIGDVMLVRLKTMCDGDTYCCYGLAQCNTYSEYPQYELVEVVNLTDGDTRYIQFVIDNGLMSQVSEVNGREGVDWEVLCCVFAHNMKTQSLEFYKGLNWRDAERSREIRYDNEGHVTLDY